MNIVKDMTGLVFGNLLVLSRDEDRVSDSGRNEVMWLCKCECGNYKSVRGASLRRGNTISCGCVRNEKSKDRLTQINTVHGKAKTRLYKVWRAMLRRCENPRDKSYKNYGEKGIAVCEEWHDVDIFFSWAYDNGYKDGLTIERLNNSHGYCPENCIWADRRVQNNNTSRNRYITYNGETKSMAQWAEVTGLSYSTIKRRANRQLSPEQILKV